MGCIDVVLIKLQHLLIEISRQFGVLFLLVRQRGGLQSIQVYVAHAWGSKAGFMCTQRTVRGAGAHRMARGYYRGNFCPQGCVKTSQTHQTVRVHVYQSGTCPVYGKTKNDQTQTVTEKISFFYFTPCWSPDATQKSPKQVSHPRSFVCARASLPLQTLPCSSIWFRRRLWVERSML